MNTPVVENLALQELTPDASGNRNAAPRVPRDIELIRHVEVALAAHIGTATLSIEKLYALREGDVVTLNELVDEPVTLLIDNRPVARGQLVAVEDHLGVEITEILAP